MSFELAPGTLLSNRYQIKKVITFNNDGGVYLARDLKVTDKNWIVKELIPAAELDEQALATRRALFNEAVESAMQFDQPALPRILDQFSEARREYVVMEHVEGVTLQTLADMSVTPLPEKQILMWGLQVCDALIYLHNRPKPFIFHALSPAHIILTPDEKIKLINFGLDRFFKKELPPKVFADDPNDILKEFVSFGETMCLLLTKEKPGLYGLPQSANISTDTAKVINRTLQGESQKTYTSFEDVRRDLDLALNPPTQPKKEAPEKRKKDAAPRPSGVPPQWKEALNRLIYGFLTQRPAFLYTELAVIVVCGLALWWVVSPAAAYRKMGESAYLAVGENKFVAMDVQSQKVADRHTIPDASIGDLAVIDNWLYATDKNSNRVYRFDVDSDQPPDKYPFIAVDRNPSKMAVDAPGKYLFVANGPANEVSRINLASDPPKMDNIISVGNLPHELTVTPNGKLLFVANKKDNNVSVVDIETNKTLSNVAVDGTPYGMTAAPEASGLNQLWVCVQDPDCMVVIDIPSMQVTQTVTDLMGGQKPTSAVFSVDGSKVYVAMAGANGTVVVFDTSKFQATKAIATADPPRRLLFTPNGNKLWVTCSGKNGVTIIDTASDSATGQIELEDATGPVAISK